MVLPVEVSERGTFVLGTTFEAGNLVRKDWKPAIYRRRMSQAGKTYNIGASRRDTLAANLNQNGFC